jgi:hypothetical protein
MSQQEEIIVRELDKKPDIHITDLESMTGLPIGKSARSDTSGDWKKNGRGRDLALVKALEKLNIH